MNELVTVDDAVVPAKQEWMDFDLLVKQRAAVVRVMREVMQDGVHFGKIPGCGDKPTLLLPGAQMLNSFFRIAPQFETEDLSTSGVVKYRVLARGHSLDGTFLGAGQGECSSEETKYAWKKAYKPEYDATPEIDRQLKKKRKKDGGSWDEYQVRQNPADVANTILKMANKRALVAMTLNITGASDVFTQDLEDLKGVIVPDDPEEPDSTHIDPPQKKSNGNKQWSVPHGILEDHLQAKFPGDAKAKARTAMLRGFVGQHISETRAQEVSLTQELSEAEATKIVNGAGIA